MIAVEAKKKEEAPLQVRRGRTLLPEQFRQLDKIMQFGRLLSPFQRHIHTKPGHTGFLRHAESSLRTR